MRLTIEWSRVRILLRPFGKFGNFLYPTLPVLSEETLKAVGPFYLVSMPGEVKDPTSPHWKCVTCRGLVDSTTHSYHTSSWTTLEISLKTFVCYPVIPVNIMCSKSNQKRATKNHHTYSYHTLRLRARTDAYLHSFLPRTIRAWNILHQEIVLAPSPESFRAQLANKLRSNQITLISH